MESWKKVLLRAVGIGLGIGTMLVLFVIGNLWRVNRPKEWTSSAITAKPTELAFVTQGESLHFRFRYALTNNTKGDYVVPEPLSGSLMKKLPEDGSLEKLEGAAWDATIRIPPNQSINVTFDVPISLATYSMTAAELRSPATSPNEIPEKYTQFVDRRLKEMNGLVLMDYGNRYRVELPSNWQKAN